VKTIRLIILLVCCTAQVCYPQQEDGVVGLELPARNSLMFHRYVLNPTFSFVRQQNKYISVNNKRELIQLGDAPQTYMANFSGRISENLGGGVGLFQQNYGVLTTFGGLVNFAYNVTLAAESNLTLGMNVGAYKSGVNSGKVVTNFPDPSLDNIPSNFLVNINPGLNYGTGFMDFGIAAINLVSYNFNTSKLLEENPTRGIQGHIMYTGYMGGYGFLEDSKFSALGRAEFRSDTSIYSGTLMLTVPKGFWVQGGYNTLYGGSAGVGLHITSQIAIEYNYEKALGGLADFGSSHEFTLAYVFPNNDYFDYSRDDEVAGLFSFEKKAKKKPRKTKPTPAKEVEATEPALAVTGTETKTDIATPRTVSETQEDSEVEEPKRLASEEPVNTNTEETKRLDTEEQARLEAEETRRLAAEEQARLEAEETKRIAAEEQARLEAEETKRIAAEEQVRLEAEETKRIVAEKQARLEAEETKRIAAEEQARLEAEETKRIAAEEQARVEAEETKRIAAEAQLKLEAEGKAAIDKLIIYPNDPLGSSIQVLAEQAQSDAVAQKELVNNLTSSVAIKDEDLKNLKEENDLSEQGVYVAPAPFKSITKENAAIEDIIINLDEIIITQKKKINQLEALLQERAQQTNDPNDATNLYYQKALAELKTAQDEATRARAQLVSSLEEITIATDFERKRRIKRAAYNNEEDRYQQDRATLNSLRQNVAVSETPLLLSDFDFGEEQSGNIQILKNVENTEEAYYLVLAVHSDTSKRDAFLTQVLASGHSSVDFFYDVNTSKYYIYYGKYDSIETANAALKIKGKDPFTENLSILKIEK